MTAHAAGQSGLRRRRTRFLSLIFGSPILPSESRDRLRIDRLRPRKDPCQPRAVIRPTSVSPRYARILARLPVLIRPSSALYIAQACRAARRSCLGTGNGIGDTRASRGERSGPMLRRGHGATGAGCDPPAPSPTSAQQLADRLARAELDRPAGRRGDVLLGRVEAQRGQDGRVHVLDRGRTDGVLESLGIGLADRQAAAEAAAGQGQAESARPVVAAARRVDLGSAAELAAAEDDGALEQVPPRSGRAASAANAGSRTLASRLVNLVVIDVSIPAVERDLDAAHADLDEPACGQAAAAEGSIAVLGGDARRAPARRRTP